MKSFENWNFEEIENSFGLTKVKNHPTLMDWVTAVEPISETENNLLLSYQNLLVDSVDTWNEEELKVFFIGPVLMLVNYNQAKCKAFLDRKLTAKIGQIEIGGVVDFLVATGKVNPRHPFFFLHEYKRARGRNNDPLGQLLATMLTAQYKNENNKPVYGSYIEGKFWNFVILAEKTYSVSEVFVATKPDLFQIVSILKRLKNIINQELA